MIIVTFTVENYGKSTTVFFLENVRGWLIYMTYSRIIYIIKNLIHREKKAISLFAL